MLRDIEEAIKRAYADYDIKSVSENEYVDSQDVLITLIAVEVMKKLTVSTADAPARRPARNNRSSRKKEDKPDPTAPTITVIA